MPRLRGNVKNMIYRRPTYPVHDNTISGQELCIVFLVEASHCWGFGFPNENFRNKKNQIGRRRDNIKEGADWKWNEFFCVFSRVKR